MKKLSTILGLLGGAVFGVLFAKKSGKELRKDLSLAKDKGKACEILGGALLDAGKESISEVENLLRRPEVKKFIEDSKDKIDQMHEYIEKEGKKMYKNASDKAKKKGRVLIKDIKDRLNNVAKNSKTKKSVTKQNSKKKNTKKR